MCTLAPARYVHHGSYISHQQALCSCLACLLPVLACLYVYATFVVTVQQLTLWHLQQDQYEPLMVSDRMSIPVIVTLCFLSSEVVQDMVKGSRDPSMRSQRHPSVFNQQYSYAPGDFLLCTQHCHHIHSHWSGVFYLLKFDHISKKERKDVKCHHHQYCTVPKPLYATQIE